MLKRLCQITFPYLEYQESCQSAENYHQDGMQLVESRAEEGKNEKYDAHNEMEHTFGRRTEILLRDKEHGSGGNESDNGRTERAKNVSDEL